MIGLSGWDKMLNFVADCLRVLYFNLVAPGR